MKRIETLEPGIYRRINPRTGKPLAGLWIHYGDGRGTTIREPVGSTSIRKARELRAERIGQHKRGEPGRAAEAVRVDALLDALIVNYEVNGRASLDTLRGRVRVLREAFGHRRAIDLTTDLIEAQQRRWQQEGRAHGTINHYGNALRRAFRLALQARKIHLVPHIPRLALHSPRGRYITREDTARLLEQLPSYLRDFFAVARAYGIRRGQLARTRTRFVDLDRGVISWPPDECKHREAHTVPLHGEVLTVVERLMANRRPWCPFLFHGVGCKPGHRPSRRYACLGDTKRAWRSACLRAGLPVGRKNGGFIFHDTRNTAATELRAGGLDEGDAMKITGHVTSHVFRHYALDDVDALRGRLATAQAKVESLSERRQRIATAMKQSGS